MVCVGEIGRNMYVYIHTYHKCPLQRQGQPVSVYTYITYTLCVCVHNEYIMCVCKPNVLDDFFFGKDVARPARRQSQRARDHVFFSREADKPAEDGF